MGLVGPQGWEVREWSDGLTVSYISVALRRPQARPGALSFDVGHHARGKKAGQAFFTAPNNMVQEKRPPRRPKAE